MNSLSFVLLLALGCYLVLAWGFRSLPREEWQILAAMPRRRADGGTWEGLNLTWYGVLNANAYLAATVILFFLLATLHVPKPAILTLAALMFGLCIPASRLVARLVEGKAHTFTVGGAVFVGTLAAPWIIALTNRLPWAHGASAMPVVATLAAFVTAYAFGEGLGRLACLSFGCCYGKPIAECRPAVRALFARWALVFSGPLKKIAYASNMEKVPVVPVQALTATLYVTTGLFNTGLFLTGHFCIAFVLGTVVTHGWRVGSEFLRADYRGDRSFSAYQWMGLAAIPYALALAVWFEADAAVRPNLIAGFAALWRPEILLALQGLWLLIFLYTGRSAVTGATLSFHVHHERI